MTSQSSQPPRRSRHLDWQGCFNARDLGGLPTRGGRETRWGAVVRADAIDELTPAGRDAMREYGVRTIVDLRNDDERDPAYEAVHVPLDASDVEGRLRSGGMNDADLNALRARLLR